MPRLFRRRITVLAVGNMLAIPDITPQTQSYSPEVRRRVDDLRVALTGDGLLTTCSGAG